MKTCSKLWNGIRKAWILTDDKPQTTEVDEIKLIQMAGEEVSAARNLFSAAEDPNMVEWAVYNLTAAEKRYDFLLKKYKQKNS